MRRRWLDVPAALSLANSGLADSGLLADLASYQGVASAMPKDSGIKCPFRGCGTSLGFKVEAFSFFYQRHVH